VTDVLDACVRQWALSLEGRLRGETGASVYAARRDDGTPVVLKLPDLDDWEAEHEVDALAYWDGDGAVGVLEHDHERRALLLERLVPGTSAWSVDEDEATRAVAGVLRRLGVEALPGHPFRPLADAAREWAEDFPELRPAVEELLADPAPQVLLHQDLHGGNVLRHHDDWVAIDPKPLVGDPAFDVASLVRDRRPIRDRRVLERRLDLLADELGHDRERMRLWSWVHAVAWGWPDEARLIRSLRH
jgi:streptomycin 6-kinase